MKKSFLYFGFYCVLLSFGSCSKKFDSINTDPTKASEESFDPNYLFTTAQLGYGNITEHQLFEHSCLTQQLASTFDYYAGGDKYNQQLTAYNSRFFTEGLFYAGQLVEAQNLAQKKDPVKYNNLIQMSRVLWVLTMQRITDTYGDIPYSQAGKGKQGIIYPKYDLQSDIYADMLSTLDDAIGKLNPNQPLPTGDLLYGGDISKWKKFGYAIMLRVAMRLTKADATLAQKYAEKVAANSFTSIEDNAIVKLVGGPNELTINKTANAIGLSDFREIRWGKTFIDYLKAGNDPRLYALTEKADTGMAFNNDINHKALSYTTESPAPSGYINEVPNGMPNGYDLSGEKSISLSPSYPGATGTGDNLNPLGNYARPKMSVFAKRDLPVFLISYSQTEFLLAEAKLKGWNVGPATAQEHFSNGLKAALKSLMQWGSALAIPEDSINNYVSQFKLDVSSTENSLQMINSQYWATSIFDFVESWSNWRRSGYPKLTAVSYPGNITNGSIPRRFSYPASENATNPANYQEALKRLGAADLPTLRIWWDKQ